MSVYGFADIAVASRLRSMASVPTTPTGASTEHGNDWSEVWEVKTPPTGIPAAGVHTDTSTFTLVACKAFYLVVDGNLIKRRAVMVDGQQLELRVGNKSRDAIPGNAYVGVTRFVGGAFIVTWAEC